MASAQNRFLNQTVASAQKTQTPNKLTQSTSTSQFTKLAQTSNSALEIHRNNEAAAVSLIPTQQSQSDVSQNQQPATAASLRSGAGALTHSQNNLRTNMFGKATTSGTQQAPGYQPSYLREPAHKGSTYASVSPMKHQARMQQSTTSVKKYGQHFSTSKRQGKLASDSKSTLGSRVNQNTTVESKLRSGSQYIAAKKLYSGHAASNSTTRGGHAAQAHHARMNRLQEEYQGGDHQTQRSIIQHPAVENSFTRLHQGNSSVVRTYERKQLQQQSTSQVRKTQQPGGDQGNIFGQSRFQQNKFRNSNAPSSNTRASGQNQLFQTKDRPSNNSQINMAQPYVSNSSVQGAGTGNNSGATTRNNQPVMTNPMDSDRTADSGKCDTARNGNNRYKGQTKQPRQSKSSSTKQNQAAASNQLRHQMSSGDATVDRPGALHVPPPPSSSSALAMHSTPQMTPSMTPTQSLPSENARLAASQSMTQVLLNSQQPSAEQARNLPNTSGLETSLSFTRRLIEETAARNERQAKEDGKVGGGPEQDISNVAVSIHSNLITCGSEDVPDQVGATKSKKLEITTAAQDVVGKPSILPKQQFISPKNKPALASGFKLGQNSVISPINSRIAGHGGMAATGTEKKVRGTSNNKVSNFTKPPATLNAAFSPDKRPNISRSQIQNNFYLKRGAKGQQANPEKSNTRENNRMQHQRMFAGQNQLTQPSNNTPGNSVSPSTKTGGPQHTPGPSYMQSTFSRSTKTSKYGGGPANVHAYQLNRVRPLKKGESTNTTQDNIPAAGAADPDKNTSSQKDLATQAAVKVLDQQAAPSILSQSQGPPKIGSTPSQTQAGRPAQGSLYSKPSIGGGMQSATKKTKSNAQSHHWPHHGGQSGFYPGSSVKESSSNKSRTGVPSHQQPLSSTNKQSRNLRPASKRSSTNQDFKKQSQTAISQSLSSGKSPLAMAAGKHHQSSTASANKITAPTQQSAEWQRRQSSLIVSDQFAKGVIEQPISKALASAAEETPAKHQRAKAEESAASGQSKLNNVYGNPLSSQSEVIHRTVDAKGSTPKDGGASGKSGKQAPKKSHSSMTESSALTGSDAAAAHSYKQKQEQIIEMIQSNMKRSEDIQQSLTSGGKFFQSVSANAHPGAIVQDFSSLSSTDKEVMSKNTAQEEDEEEENNDGEVNPIPGLKAPTPSKSSSQNKKTFAILEAENQADVPLFKSTANLQSSPAMTGLRGEPAIESWEEQRSGDVVEDVFNDAQILQNRITEDETTPVMDERISILPEISPAEQPEDGSSSEGGGLGADDVQSPINLMASSLEDKKLKANLETSGHEVSKQQKPEPKQLMPVMREPQSAFAMALANKKANGEDFVSTLTPQQHQPMFDHLDEVEDKQPQPVMKMEELEVVTEDVQQEDRYSLVSSAASKSLIKHASHMTASAPTKSITSLPMESETFKALYRSVLTEQELKELQELDLTNGMVYYANDVPTRVNQSAAITNKDDEEGYYVLQPKDQILYRFEVIKVLGKGSFAQVVSAIDHMTGCKVAVKINRNTEIDHKFAKQEGKLLKFLMDEDPSDENNIVRMVQHIHFREHQCFVFELLNTDLFEHLKENEFMGFPEEQIRSYAAQLLKALVFLEKRSVIHCDLKPENILCVDPARSQLKVVDFGSGCLVDEQVYTYVQSRYYRAPEVILRIKYSDKVDMWSLGCILAELYTGEPLFPGNNEQEQLEFIMELLGMFPETMIDKSRKKDHYFDTDYSPFLIEDSKYGILRIPENRSIEEAIPSNDRLFLDFVSQCLILDPEARPGASEASKHPWLRSFFGGPSSESIQSQINVGRMEERDFELPVTNETAYLPLRQQPKKVQSFLISSQHESLNELHGNMMFMENEANLGDTDPQPQEYFEGRGSMQALTETGGFPGDMSGAAISDGEETVKFGQSIVSQSRQREEAGARASAAEISPDRPIGSLLSEQQRMTSFVSGQSGIQAQNSFGSFNLHPVAQSSSVLQQSAKKASPLKPSNESLLEHYKYEKQSKGAAAASGSASGSAANASASNFHEQLQRSSKKQQQQLSSSATSKSAATAPANVEEPKIISLTTSGFTQQQKQ